MAANNGLQTGSFNYTSFAEKRNAVNALVPRQFIPDSAISE
jgi:hypothetical protein